MIMETEKHICGRCGQEFEIENQYLDHECPETGFTPRDPEHQGEGFAIVQKAALARGEAKKNG